MVHFCRILLALILVVGALDCTSSFLVFPKHLGTPLHSTTSLCAKSHPEFSVVGDENTDSDESSPEASGDYISIKNSDAQEPPSTSQRPEYGAMAPGTVVKVQIGDLSLARKAWKKRRRTGSPLLVPCSILNIDRQSMVRWNLIYLLEKFGKSQKDGVGISATELSKKYRTHLKSSLQVCFSCIRVC